MMRKAAMGLGVAAALVGLYVWGRRAAEPVGTDGVQIRAELQTAVDEFNDGNLAGAMSLISHDYKDSMGNNRDRLYVLGRRAVTAETRGTITLQRFHVELDGDTAIVPVTVMVDWEGVPKRDYDVDLTMAREPARKWLIYPTKRWRVTSADSIPGVTGDDSLF